MFGAGVLCVYVAVSCASVSQCVAVCCSALQCVAVCCSVLQCVAVCCAVSCSVRAHHGAFFCGVFGDFVLC